MIREEFYEFLTRISDWYLGTQIKYEGRGRPRKNPRPEPEPEYDEYGDLIEADFEEGDPEGQWPIIKKYHERVYPCEFCESDCTKPKTYSRKPGETEWRVKCHDCGLKQAVKFPIDRIP